MSKRRQLWTRTKSENLLPSAEKCESDSNAVGRKTEHNRQSGFHNGKEENKKLFRGDL